MVIHIWFSEQTNKPQQIATESAVPLTPAFQLLRNRGKGSSAEDSTTLQKEGWRILLLKQCYFASYLPFPFAWTE